MTQQLKIISLNCPNCAGALEIHGDMERFACGYCGSEQIVERRGGTIGLRLVADAVARVQVGTDKTAAELALVRLNRELADANARWQEADRVFRFQNQSTSTPAVAVILLSAGTFVIALMSFIGFAAAGTAAGPSGQYAIGSMFLCIVFAGGAVPVFRWALKELAKTKKRYSTRRSELWSPHEKQIQRLEMQIGKNRRLIHS